MQQPIEKQGDSAYVYQVFGLICKKAILRHAIRGLWVIEIYQYAGMDKMGVIHYEHDFSIHATNERQARITAKNALEGIVETAKQMKMKGF